MRFVLIFETISNQNRISLQVCDTVEQCREFIVTDVLTCKDDFNLDTFFSKNDILFELQENNQLTFQMRGNVKNSVIYKIMDEPVKGFTFSDFLEADRTPSPIRASSSPDMSVEVFSDDDDFAPLSEDEFPDSP